MPCWWTCDAVIETYGKGTVDAMRAEGSESYAQRADRYAAEEARLRASGSREQLRRTMHE